MTQHIGIVACSAEGAALCYRTICAEAPALLGPYSHPEISMHTPPLSDYVSCLTRGDMKGVGDLMLSSAEKLSRIGADFLICPDNTIHQAFNNIVHRLPLPWLHIAEIVANQAKDQNFHRLGLLGTQWLMESQVYSGKLSDQGLVCDIPALDERKHINRIIMDELVAGIFKPEAITYFQKIIYDMKQSGCDAVILGCTEIPLIMNDANSPLPTLNSTKLIARAAIWHAINHHHKMPHH